MAARTPKIRPTPPAAFVRSAPFFDDVVPFVVPVGFKSVVSVPVPVVWVGFVVAKVVGVVVEVVEVVFDCVIENCCDWA